MKYEKSVSGKKRTKKKSLPASDFQTKRVDADQIDCNQTLCGEWSEKDLSQRAAYLLLHGAPIFSVNASEGGRYALMAGERDFFAAKKAGIAQLDVRVYAFSESDAAAFSAAEQLKDESLGAMESAYLMKKLISAHGWTQADIAEKIGKSRPSVANTLRLLTLSPEVVGLVESGRFSAGHARSLVAVPKEKQLAFAEEILKRGYSVRETERAVKAFLTPPEVLQSEKAAAAAAKSEQLKAFVERMRSVFRTKVSLIGNDKKGRIYIDYYSAEDLYRFEEMLDMIEQFDRGEHF